MSWSLDFLLNRAVDALVFLILVDVILGYIPSVDRWHPLVLTLRKITRPLYAPFQRLLPASKTGNIDFSPFLAVLALSIALQILRSILF